jgi:hypothetical protein
VAIPSSLAAPASISNSYRRPRAIAVTSFLRVRLLARAHSGNPPFGWDGVWRRHNRSPAMDRKPAGQDSTELFAPGTVTVPAPFAVESQFLSGSSCCWFEAERIVFRSASSPMSRSPTEVGSETGSNSTHRGSNPGSPASHRGLSPRFPGIPRTGAISEGWRPKARSLARDTGHFVRNAENSEASLCSMNFQYPKFRDGTSRDRLRFGAPPATRRPAVTRTGRRRPVLAR